MMVLTPAASNATGWVLAFSTIGVFVALIVAPVVGIFMYRARRRPESRMRRVIDAGMRAVPGMAVLSAGVIGMIIGIVYLVGLFLYWLVYVIVATVAVDLTGSRVTFPAEMGHIVAVGFLYFGLGLLLALAGSVWLIVVITAAVRRTQRLLRGTVYTNAPSADPPPLLPGPLTGPRE